MMMHKPLATSRAVKTQPPNPNSEHSIITQALSTVGVPFFSEHVRASNSRDFKHTSATIDDVAENIDWYRLYR